MSEVSTSKINTFLLTALLGVASFIGVTVFQLSITQASSVATVTQHTKQLDDISKDTKIALTVAYETKGDLALLKYDVGTIKRKQ